MCEAFFPALSFYGDVSSINVENAISMVGILNSALLFNQGISSWNKSHVTNVDGMFIYARSFCHNLSSCDVSTIESRFKMQHVSRVNILLVFQTRHEV